MRNLPGSSSKNQLKYRRVTTLFLTFLILLPLFIIILWNPYSSFAQGDETKTTSDATIEYTIEPNGDLLASVTASLNNITDLPLPVRLFKTSVPFPNASAISAKYSNEYLHLASAQKDNHTEITIDLENRILRKNSPMELRLYFTIPGYYSPEEPVLNIPSGYTFTNIKHINLQYPKSFGEPTSIEPSNYTEDTVGNDNRLNFKEMKGVDIYMLLSDQLVYRYNQKNQLINSDSIEKLFDVVIPPNSNTQTIILTTIEPKPNKTEIDSEGNVILQYLLSPSENLDVVLGGFISKHPKNLDEIVNSLNPNYSEMSGYWEIEKNTLGLTTEKDFSWSELPKGEREDLLLTINRFVTKQLNSEKFESNSIQFRKGAAESAKGHNAASPQDYVDLTIALMRSYGIPSRQVLGYSTNLQDLFKSSTTHTWVQYWDPESDWSSMDTYQDDILGTNRVNIASTDRIILMNRGLDPVFPQYTSHTLEYLTIKLTDETVAPTTSIALEADDLTWDITESIVELPIRINNTGSTMINVLSLVTPTGELLDLLEKVIMPGQEIEVLLPLNVSVIDEIKSNNDENLSIGVEAKSTLGTSTFSLVSVQNETTQPWWWAPLITLLTLASFLLIIIILVYLYKFIKNQVK